MTRVEAIKILEMFLHKQCDLERTNFAYTQSEVWNAVKMASEALEKQEESKWIPCSERLPEQNGKYLVTVGEGKFPPRVFEYKNDEKFYWENEIGCRPNVDYVKAWQPLPEPYKEGDT